MVAYWLAFSMVPGIGPVRVRRLLDHFGDLETAWRASAGELGRAGLEARAIDSLLSRRVAIDPAAELDRVEAAGVALVTLDDPAYPERLRQIYGPPTVLHFRGDLRPTDDLAIAIVGTRRATPYGRQAAERISADLAAAGTTIVSGLARGIDTCAHRAALDVGGRTIAVLGCGVDVTYPTENARLAAEIAEKGAVVSEYPLGTPPDAANFPARNRIVSGLTRGTLVVEAGETSGALITARFAAEQGREVFAVPGSVFSHQSRGTNRLIQEGARLVTSGRDILDDLQLEAVGRQLELRDLLPADELERVVLALLNSEPRHVDDITRATTLSAAQVGATLAMLEIKGLARHVGAMSYVAG